MDWLSDPEIWIALLTLTALEIVLGIDNIVFISILAGKLPAGAAGAGARRSAWRWRWSCASLLLLSISWVIGLTEPLFTVLGQEILRPRPDPARRRAVPARQEHLRDPRASSRAQEGHASARVRGLVRVA